MGRRGDNKQIKEGEGMCQWGLSTVGEGWQVMVE